MKKKLFCIVAGALTLLGCGAQKMPEGDIIYLEYTESGTMRGYQYEGRVERDSTGAFVLTAMKENYGPLFQKQIGKEEMKRLRQIVQEEKMYNYKEHYRPRLQVLDGYGWHFEAKFSEGDKIYSSGSNARPGGNGLGRIHACLLQFIEDADRVVESDD